MVLRPHPGGQLSWASGCYQSVRGPIVTRWRRSADRFTFSVELPPNGGEQGTVRAERNLRTQPV